MLQPCLCLPLWDGSITPVCLLEVLTTTATHGYITRQETLLPVPVKSMPFNKCWKKKVICAWELYLWSVCCICMIFLPFAVLDSSPGPHIVRHCSVWAGKPSLASWCSGGERGTFLGCAALLWKDGSLFFWAWDTFPGGTAASSLREIECSSC